MPHPALLPADPDAAELIAEYAAAKARADAADSDVAELKNRLLGALGSRYGLTAPAGKVLQIRSDGRETIDGAALASVCLQYEDGASRDAVRRFILRI